MRSDSVAAGWEACECDHVKCQVNQTMEFFSPRSVSILPVVLLSPC